MRLIIIELREALLILSQFYERRTHEMANVLYNVFIGVVVWTVCGLIKKATYRIITKIRNKKNDDPTKNHRS